MIESKRLYFLLIIVIIIVSACDQTRVFEDYYPIHEDGWHKDSLVVFHFPVTDTTQNHNLYLNTRNDLDYNYRNLWLFINIEGPDGRTLKDTFEVLLANPAGKWFGEGFGGLKELQTEYKRNVFFPTSGEYEVTIQHAMRAGILAGLKDIGIRVEKDINGE